MKTTATNRRLRELLTNLKEGKLKPRPEFQRRLVWNNKDKSNFIETVLCNYPFPEIYIASGDINVDTMVADEMLVDGQQRITTLYQYYLNSEELKLSQNIKPFHKLSPDEKEAFLQYDVVVRDLGKVDIEQIRNVFERINATRYSLNAMEINNARYSGEFKLFAENLAQNAFFSKYRIFSASEIRRMQDTRFVLTILTTILSSYFQRDDEVESFLIRYNDEFENKTIIEENIIRILNLIDHMNFEMDARVWQKSDLFSLIIELYRYCIKQNKSLDITSVSKNLKEFYIEVDKVDKISEPDQMVYKYYQATLQGTNDRSNRITRGEIIQKILLKSSGD